MWFDELNDSECQSLTSLSHGHHIANLRSQGFTIIPGAVSEADCRSAISAYSAYVESRTENPRTPRFQNAHLLIPEVLKVATNAQVQTVLELLFSETPALWSTLYFRYGSQQATHVDGPYFATSPESTFLGVWTALEPVSIDAGPLFYWNTGHQQFIDPVQAAHEWANRYAASAFWDEPDWWSLYNFKMDPRFDVSLWNWYQSEIEMKCVTAGLNRHVALLEPGDTLIWHPRLPHGGSKIESNGATRNSVVSHYVPRSAKVGGPDVFHGIRGNYLKAPCVAMGDNSVYVFQQGHGFGG